MNKVTCKILELAGPAHGKNSLVSSSSWYIFEHRVLIVGKNEFSPDEDAHVVGDCVKVLFFPNFMKFGFRCLNNF